MRVRKWVLTMVLPLLCIPTAATAENCGSPFAARSGPVATNIVELYTSEGCDSCPPADKWFSTIGFQKDGVIPLTFHVDYWDYIGWKDRFAKPGFTQRQRDTVTRQGGRTTYTPQVMLDGRDVGLWSYPSRLQSRLREIASRPARASISIEATIANDTLVAELVAAVPLQIDRAESAVFIAITENKLSSRVTAGENKGAVLKHDHVVRELFGPLMVDAGDRTDGKFSLRQVVSILPEWKHQDLSLVAFLQNTRTGNVLQAVSTPICHP